MNKRFQNQMNTTKIIKLLFSTLFLLSTMSNAQNLTISNTGLTSSPGTWSITGTTLTVTGTANIRASVIVNALANGNLTVVGNTNNFAVTVSEAINATTAGSGLTIGSMTNAGAITIGADITLAGGIAIMGGYVQLNGNITSTATGDLFFQGIAEPWSIVLATGKTIEKTAGTGLLTMQGNSRINNSTSVGSILASGTARLDVVIINEMDDGTVGLSNVSTGNITTNSGHLWISAGAKTRIWNGLSVGSTGVPGNSQYNGIDVTGNISTNGGDILLWAFVGSNARSAGYGDITALSTNRTISSGSGDITLMTRYNDFVNGSPDINISTTGALTLTPASGASFDVGLSITGTTASGTFTGSGFMGGLIIQNFTSLNELVIGTYNGTGASGDSPYTPANTADITLSAAISIAGPISIYGGDITVSQNLTSTLAGADILLQASGAINLASSKSVQSNAGNITLRSNSGGTALITASSIILNSGSSLLSQGGNITLGGNFTGAQGAGLYATSGNAPAILISGGTISAAGGNIKLYGKCNGSYDDGIRLTGTINTTGTGTIELYGEAYGGLTGSTYFGGVTFGTANTTVSTENGNLTIEGILTNTNSSSASGLNFYRVAGGNGSLSIQLLSKTGNIQVSGRKAPSAASFGIGQCSQGNVYIGSPIDNSWTASGNIFMSLSSFDLAGSTGIIFKTTGALNVEPYDASFNSTLTFPFTNNSSISNVSAFTMGKASNTANITIGAPGISVAGPITLYGGTLSLGANITSTAGGEIALYSDAALAGLSSARSMTTTGAFRYLPQGTSFSSTVTFPITNLSLVNITELQLGKSGNTAGITIGSSATIAGNIYIYGGILTLNGNLTATNDGNIFLNSDNAIAGLLVQRNVTAAGSFNYISQSNSFATAITFPIANLNVSCTGLLIGKLSNATNISFDSNTSIAGSITAYGGTIALDANLTTTNNGDISLYTDNALGGLTTTARTINASGSFNYIPRSDFFSVPVTYPINNLTLASSGLLIGKPTNTANITFANTTTVAGSITAYGGTVTLNANLTTTNNGAISLYTDNALGGLNTARTLTAAGAFKYIPRTTTFSADVTYPITNLTATSTGLTIGNATNTKNITINQDVTGGAGIELYGANVNINSNLKTTSGGAMYLKGITTIAAGKYIESNGNFTHDGNMTFKSDATGTAAFGTLGGTFTTVSGTSTVERYIPAKRAYRFLSPSVTTTTSIRDNWQENGGTTAGLGTHITGTSGTTDGFDLTTTNNPSLYTINHSTGLWAPVTNTNVNTLSAGTAYRLMVRGDRTISLATNAPTATVTTLRATGVLKTGSHSPTLNQASEGYSFVGNPYQAPVDIKAVLTASTNMNSGVVYYWDPTLNDRGAYVTRDLTSNNNSVTSNFNQYLQPGQAVFVKKVLTSNAASMLFTEDNKSLANSATGVFRTTATENFGTIRTNLRASIDNQWTTIEGALAVFNPMYSWEVNQDDANKFSNLDEEVSFMQNNTSLAIACQSNPSATNELPIRLNTTRRTNYQWQFELGNYSGPTPYLFDNQNNTYTLIDNNTIVPFTVNGQELTRFKIVFQNGTLSTPDFSNQIVLYPNPGASGASSFNIEGITDAEVSLYTLLGQKIPVRSATNGKGMEVISKTSLSKGVYLVGITKDGKTSHVKWIVE